MWANPAGRLGAGGGQRAQGRGPFPGSPDTPALGSDASPVPQENRYVVRLSESTLVI